jgi:hypothetical protein
MLLSILLLSMLSLTACDWQFSAKMKSPARIGTCTDYVFAGPSPDPPATRCTFKLNMRRKQRRDRENLGVFYAEVTGMLTDDSSNWTRVPGHPAVTKPRSARSSRILGRRVDSASCTWKPAKF